LFGLRTKPPVSADEFEWLIACTAWAVEVLGGEAAMRARALVLPTSFPRSTASGHAYAVELFDHVKWLAGMADWPCELEIGAADRGTKVGLGLALKHETKGPPLGTYRTAGNAAVISYNPSLLARPADLVATFAHELAHYRIHAQPDLPPGGADLEEHATDLVAALLGFGVFSANAAKNFAQFQTEREQGWEMRAAGYLSELALVTELALFTRLSGADAKAAERELKPYLRGPFRKALAACDREADDPWELIRKVDLAHWA
jgi:hypothetical protein